MYKPYPRGKDMSHILNSCYQSRYRPLGFKRMSSTSESSSSESSTQYSPEYPQAQQSEFSNNDQYQANIEKYWKHNQTINVSANQSSDEDVEDETIDVENSDLIDTGKQSESENTDDISLVEGDDYEIIQVYTVNPDLNLIDGSSDDESEEFITENVNSVNNTDFSNVDDYCIADYDKSLLQCSDEPVVKDVDEYFIKEQQPVTNEDEFLIKTEPTSSNEEAVQLNNSDLEVLPDLEDLKKYMFEELTANSKIKNLQKSLSVPHSPHHLSCLDLDDGKTWLSFEDLNLDMVDLFASEKSGNENKSDDVPRTLTEEDVNSFLNTEAISTNDESHAKSLSENKDDFSHQDMEIEKPLETRISCGNISIPPTETLSVNINDAKISAVSTPIKKDTILDFCIEKPIQLRSIKTEAEDVIDIESCNETVIPVLEANNLNSLLEQFEASELLNSKPKNAEKVIENIVEVPKVVPKTVLIKRPLSPVQSDHDYCFKKKVKKIRGGQSLLKPEVLSSNNKILKSRHRSCKKNINYSLSSDDEVNSKQKKTEKSNNINCANESIKKHSEIISKKVKTVQNEATDVGKNNISIATPKSGDINITIKNQVILLKCDVSKIKSGCETVSNCNKIESCSNSVANIKKHDIVQVKKESNQESEQFYTTLFTNKQDVKIPEIEIKTEEVAVETINSETPNENAKKKKRLNFEEYKLRKGASNSNSAAVSPELIFPDLPSINTILNNDATVKICPQSKIVQKNVKEIAPTESTKKVFDPIREASRKILLLSKKQKAEAIRKRDEDIVMSKIPKVENLELQPLMSDAEMMKIVGANAVGVTPVSIVEVEKPKVPSDCEEIIRVSIGTNTTHTYPMKSCDAKSLINFKIKKSDNILKQNVFDPVKPKVDDDKNPKIDENRYKDIKAELKRVKKQVDTKISVNSLFASIQDTVLKKAPKKSSPPPEKPMVMVKTNIVREYDASLDHGEDKVILYLDKNRPKPTSSSVSTQTDILPEFEELTKICRQRFNSGGSNGSSVHDKNGRESQKRSRSKERSEELRSKMRSLSKERYDSKRRHRSRSRNRKMRSKSRGRTRSPDRYRRYRRSHSPYKRRRKSRSPPFRRSVRRDYRSRSRTKISRPRHTSPEKRKSPKKRDVSPEKRKRSLTPVARKPTVSESSDSSTCSSSSSSTSSSSSGSDRSDSSRSSKDDKKIVQRTHRDSEDRESNTPVEERRIVFVGRLEKDINKSKLRSKFSKFGSIIEVRLHSKEDGSRYGFVTFQNSRDAWSAVESAGTFPQYDVGFGGRRAFCRQSYADLDGLEAQYSESAFSVQPAPRHNDMSFEQMLLEMKKKLGQIKNEKRKDNA